MSGSGTRFALAVRALRLPFVSASALPYVYGVLLAGSFRLERFALGLAAVVLTHLSANLANDLADQRSGVDAIDTRYFGFFGGSKLLQQGLAKTRTYRLGACLCAVLALVAMLSLAAMLGIGWLPFASVLVLLLAWGYSFAPVKLSYRGLGEVTVFLLFGPVTVAGGAFLQTGIWPAWHVWLQSVPPGLLVAGILLANEVPDAGDDLQAHKQTLVGLIGAERGWMLYAGASLAAYLLIALFAVTGVVPLRAMLALLAMPFSCAAAGVLIVRGQRKTELIRASKFAITAQILGLLGLLAGGVP
jgi:1,4-dihydroxy-2-naphthoate octaprenyltransferase